jgi:hypothetical protein
VAACAVAFVVIARVLLDPLVIEIDVLDNGGNEKVPVAFDAVAFVASVRTFPPSVMVSELEDTGEAEPTLPVALAGTPVAVKTSVPLIVAV